MNLINIQNLLKKMGYSFSKVSNNQEISNINHPKIKILRNLQDKNFISSLRDKMSLQTKYAIEIFETINDLGDESQKKERIKAIY